MAFFFRPVNLPPYQRDKIDTFFTFYSRNDTAGYSVSGQNLVGILNSTFDSSRRIKIIIHGYLNYGRETWILVRLFTICNTNGVIYIGRRRNVTHFNPIIGYFEQ